MAKEKRDWGDLLHALMGKPWDDDAYRKMGEELGTELLLALVRGSNPAPFLAAILNDPENEGVDAPLSSLTPELVARCLEAIEAD